MSITIKIKIHHQVPITEMQQMLDMWGETQSIVSITNALILGDNVAFIETSWDNDEVILLEFYPGIKQDLEEDFNNFLAEFLPTPVAPEVPWYQENERFSIDNI